jgi:hypothetical protein
MLYNYSILKGIVSKDLEDHIKKRETHYKLLVNANNLRKLQSSENGKKSIEKSSQIRFNEFLKIL